MRVFKNPTTTYNIQQFGQTQYNTTYNKFPTICWPNKFVGIFDPTYWPNIPAKNRSFFQFFANFILYRRTPVA